MTKITQYIEEAKGKTLFSIEIIPPVKGESIQTLMNNIEPLMEFQPPFIEVTYHREEFIEKVINGRIEKIPTRKRPGTVGICASIMNRFKVDAVPHVICGGFTQEETEYMLVDCQYLGINNVMALRGDAMKDEQSFVPKAGGNHYAIDLVKQIKDLNCGQYLHEVIDADNKADFCIGVAGYPEKHFEAPNLNADFKFLKKKVDMGAEFIVTQMFFDNRKFFEFVAKCRKEGITVPIIPGLKPISTKKQLNQIPHRFKVDLPDDLIMEVVKAADNEAVKQIGIEWCIEQSKEDLWRFQVEAHRAYKCKQILGLLHSPPRMEN